MNAIGEQISAILWNVFNRPRLIDLIDILLLTIIIYELLVHVRQTRVSQTIKGIIILLLATWLSDVLGMRTIHALLAWMINAGPVLLIVLFQSEIRRILEELGNNSVFENGHAGRQYRADHRRNDPRAGTYGPAQGWRADCH
ncbi:MAG: hypothetical protein ACLUMK_02805 [Christensenellales bacterium]